MSILQPQLGVAVLLFNRGKILLAERISDHEGGRFGCPGGKVDFSEDLDVTALRECREETKISIPPKRMKPVGFIANCVYPVEGKHFLCVWFTATYEGPAPTFIEKKKNGDPKCKGWNWYTRKQVKDMPLMMSTIAAWDHWDNTSGRFLLKHYVRA